MWRSHEGVKKPIQHHTWSQTAQLLLLCSLEPRVPALPVSLLHLSFPSLSPLSSKSQIVSCRVRVCVCTRVSICVSDSSQNLMQKQELSETQTSSSDGTTPSLFLPFLPWCPEIPLPNPAFHKAELLTCDMELTQLHAIPSFLYIDRQWCSLSLSVVPFVEPSSARSTQSLPVTFKECHFPSLSKTTSKQKPCKP